MKIFALFLTMILSISSCEAQTRDQVLAGPRQRVQMLISNIPARPPVPPLSGEFANMQVYIQKSQYLLRYYQPSDVMLKSVNTEIQNALWSQSMIASKTQLVVRGLREEGYYSPVDNSYQPFVRFIPSTYSSKKSYPMLVYLHGYSPDMNIINWSSYIYKSILELAEKEEFIVVMPFGRSNTDFQGIGELDVLSAMKKMQERFNIDKQRIVLSGMSMGGMGVWTIGSHYPDLFASLLVFSGRGDYYNWHDVKPKDLPPYKRILIDREFGYSRQENLKKIPILCYHGSSDTLIDVTEFRHIKEAISKINPHSEFIEIPNGSHWVCNKLFEGRKVRDFVVKSKNKNLKRPMITKGSRIKNALLSPFMFVDTGNTTNGQLSKSFKKRIFEWYRYTKSWPRFKHEKNLTPQDKQNFNLFLFGEPETSPLIARIAKNMPVKITKDAYMSASTTVARDGHGLYMACPSPWKNDGLVVIQSGLAWGEGLSENHLYDFLPDFIIYNDQRDSDGSNTALLAGFFSDSYKIAKNTLYSKK